MTDHKNNPATFTADRETVDTATHYRNADGAVLKIANREFCPLCGGVICIVTTKDRQGKPTRATFVRLHMDCVKAMQAKQP